MTDRNTNVAYIIIGAAGFLGSAFSRFLKENNHEVFEVYRGQISGIESDFHFISELLQLKNKEFKVVDFAYTSVPNSSFSDPVKDYSENLYNVIRHLEFVKQLPEATYIYISSGGTVYGNPEKHEPIDEQHPNFPLSPYGITKLSCEKYVLMYEKVHGLNVKIVRPSNIYGPGQKPFRGQGLVATAIAKILKNESIQVFGNGLQVRDYLYVDDFCKLLYDVINSRDSNNTYNMGSGIGYSINELLKKIESLLKIPVTIEHQPGRPFDVEFNVLNSAQASALNNWRPSVSLDEGLNKSIEWIKNFAAHP